MNWMNKKVEESPYKLAMLGGTVIAIAATIVMAAVQSWFPGFRSEGLEAVNQLLAGPPVLVAILLFLIIIVGPIMEELIFRKFLWWMSSLMFSPITTFFVISILFAGVHGSLFHAIGVLPSSFFFGWLRLRTGSVKHCTVAHITNNATASIFFFL